MGDDRITQQDGLGTAARPGTIACTGSFGSWREALAASTGHYLPEFVEQTRIAAARVRDGEVPYERDSVVFDRIQHSFPLLAALLRAAASNDNRLIVLDFGGAFGTSYFQCRQFLEPVREIEWLVVDQPSHVEIGSREFSSDRLKFYSSIELALARHRPNVALLSGVLPCVPEPYGLLFRMAELGLPYLILDRTFLLDRDADRLTVQQGPYPIYPGSYPAWFLSETRLRAVVESCGYGLLADFDGFDRVAPIDEGAHTKGFVFVRALETGGGGDV